MPKVVINVPFGGFNVPDEVVKLLGYEYMHQIEDKDRADPRLVAWLEKNQNLYPDLSIVNVPDDVKWHIEEYDGSEHVAEDHRTWHAA